ncbi:MAG TPA: glutathione S-transferase N-terminal domain-containing protein [Steroidobacteraceae bacterium]|nr:glutathione S-transferase N-terminal domain-containing protein [Steroidobacteraceae bacterium]
MLKVWGRRSSLNVQKVMWLIGELQLPHEHIPAGGTFGRLDEAQFRALNPHGRVPVIQDGELAVWESHAILRYLAAQYGGGRFWSDDPAARSQVDRWMDWAQTTLQPAFIEGVFLTYFRTPPTRRDPALIARNVQRCGQLFQHLDEVMRHEPVLAQAEPTLADIPIAANLYRYFELDIERPKLPRIEAWYARLQQRSAYREHVMVSFEELRGREP